MADHKFANSATETGSCFKEAVCIDTNKIYDSCADRDCLEDLRVYFTDQYQPIIDQASSVRCRRCEILDCFIDVEAIQFNRGFYSVDMTFCFRVTLDAYTCPSAPPTSIDGLCVFSKKCILYGSEGNVKVFSSEFAPDEQDEQFLPQNANPKAKVQTVDPVILGARVADACNCCDMECCCAPTKVCNFFQGSFDCFQPQKVVYVSLGLFTIVQLEREVQILIPAYDFCVPDKECDYSITNDDPCSLFKQIKFPHEEFFPKDEDRDGKCGCK